MSTALQPIIGGAYKDIDKGYVNIGGAWKLIDKVMCNIGGTWREGWVSFIADFLYTNHGITVKRLSDNNTDAWNVPAIYTTTYPVVATDDNYNAYILDFTTNGQQFYVTKYDKDKNLIWQRGWTSAIVYYLTVAKTYQVILFGNNSQLVSADGSTCVYLGAGLIYSALEKGGYVYGTDSSYVYKVNLSSQSQSWSYNIGNTPYVAHIDNSGNVIVLLFADKGSGYKLYKHILSNTGVADAGVVSLDLSTLTVTSIDSDANGNIYILDGSTFKVYKIPVGQSTATVIATLTPTFGNQGMLHCDVNGNVFVVIGRSLFKIDASGNKIFELDDPNYSYHSVAPNGGHPNTFC